MPQSGNFSTALCESADATLDIVDIFVLYEECCQTRPCFVAAVCQVLEIPDKELNRWGRMPVQHCTGSYLLTYNLVVEQQTKGKD